MIETKNFLTFLQIKCKLTEVPEEEKSEYKKTNCTIFLSYTSNMISSGIREYIRFLVQHKMVRCYFQFDVNFLSLKLYLFV